MPSQFRFCWTCFFSSKSSTLRSVPVQSTTYIKSIIHPRISKKPIDVMHHGQRNLFKNLQFKRIKGSNLVREFVSCIKSQSRTKKANNYDMTILHDDQLNNAASATIHRRKKKIPFWAQKDQLELAIINQVFFQDNNPDDIFGSVCIDNVLEMINSMNIKNKESNLVISSNHL